MEGNNVTDKMIEDPNPEEQVENSFPEPIESPSNIRKALTNQIKQGSNDTGSDDDSMNNTLRLKSNTLSFKAKEIVSLPKEYFNFSGYLDKKAHTLLGGYQKRFFRIIEGTVILYYEKENDNNAKGQLLIKNMSTVVAIKKDELKFNLETKDYTLKAPSTELRDKWLTIINALIEYQTSWSKKKAKEPKLEDINGSNDKDKKGKKDEKKLIKTKIEDWDKNTLDLIRKSGFGANEDMKLNEHLLTAKGINKLINLNNKDIKSRFYSGFLYKKRKDSEYYQKRWFFLFSSRPISDSWYEEDDSTLESSKWKGWMKFDHFFYFKYENKDEKSGPIDGMDLCESHKIAHLDKEGKYFLHLDVADRKYIFYSDIKGDRDLWFEALRNSRRTAKEVQASIFKKPKNIQRYWNIFNKGESVLWSELKHETMKSTGNYEDIKDFETLSFVLTSLQNEICSTIDGCISTSPPQKDLLAVYCNYYLDLFLKIVEHYWNTNYREIEGANIIKLSSFLFEFDEKLSLLHVSEQNNSKNAKEFIKIYMKKTYKNLTDVILSILKSEREVKGIKMETGEWMTNGPSDLFDIISKTFGLIQDSKIKYVHAKMLGMFYECIVQYLIGVDCIISNYNIIVETEFLLAVANNSFEINHRIINIIDNFKKSDVLDLKEINDEMRTKEIYSSLNLISSNAVSRLVTDLSQKLAESFNCNFLDLEWHKILTVTNEIYGPLNAQMNGMTKKKCWSEIWQLSVFYYIKLLLTTAHKKVKTIDELTHKLTEDKEMFMETYVDVAGEFSTEAQLKIIVDILDFLQVSSFMVTSACHTFREYMGPSFTLATAKAVINLRCDFTRDQKKDALNLCKEVLDNFVDNNRKPGGNGFFDKMQKELKNENEDPNEHDSPDETNEEERRKQEQTNIYDLEGFLEDPDEDEETGSKKGDQEEGDEEEKEEEEDKVEEKISDVIIEGMMAKKSYSSWQDRFFQLKNGYLYWFKNKESSNVQNKISIKSVIKVETHKNKKFLIIVGEGEDTKDEGKKKKKAKDKGALYKFKAKTDELKEEWITKITQEMKRLKGEEKEKKEEIYWKVKPKAKIIWDKYNLADVGNERANIKERIKKDISSEPHFKFKETAYSSLKKPDGTPKSLTEINDNTSGEFTDQRIDLNNEGSLQQFEIGFEDARDENVNSNPLSCCSKCWDSFMRLLSGESKQESSEQLNPK